MKLLSISSPSTPIPHQSPSHSSPSYLKPRTLTPFFFSLSSFPSKPTTLRSSPSLKTSAAVSPTNFSESLYASAAAPAAANPLDAPVEADAVGMLLKERIIFLGEEISDFVADAISSQLLLLDAQDSTKDIRVLINSPGGSLSATMAIYDIMQLIRAPVCTIAIGMSASTASLILGGGTKGKRFAMPNTRIMIHQPQGGFSGVVLDVEVQAKEIIQNKKDVATLISSWTGRTPEQVGEDIAMDRYMSPIEAVEYGIIDGIIDRDSILPLEPVPEKITPSLHKEWMSGEEFATPVVPDDEIY